MMSKTLIVASVLAVALTACNKKEETAAPAGGSAPATTAPAPAPAPSTPAPAPAPAPGSSAPSGGSTTPAS
ncbi:endopeptidase [Bordetella genomosp. 5]|uniref:Endopeptidase n=1 Tax=Bordetella genomosp. 5 TaxID=1395608 RepID=A0A261TB44_9BORD|nr:endopeptidase [Bordetella genomosp. 5]